ncbi:MAG TPA: nucleoside triphosphate pyrophosphohydrolase [Thermodesulfobacteriota bacterium]
MTTHDDARGLDRGPAEGRGADRFGDLVTVMARLRGEGGCPWDREQTPASLKPYIVEEAYEVLEALDDLGPAAAGGAPARAEALAHLREELGDLLLQVVFQAEIATQRGWFTIGEVIGGIVDKLVRRHPHVFGDRHVDSPTDALANWEQIKLAERQAKAAGGRASALDGVPRHLPALLLAQRVSDKAARVGFDWPDVAGVLAKVDEERAELAEAMAEGRRERIAEELGDLLFALVNVGRFVGVPAEEALRAATARFTDRFRRMEAGLAAEGRTIGESDADDLDRRWEAAKRAVAADER